MQSMVGNILIIDDSPIDRKIIRQVLEKKLQHISIFEARDGADVAHQISANNIHVCILDIMMPVKNGFQVLEEIKQDTLLMDIPIIICTGINDNGAIERALLLGAYDYFSKPLGEEAMKISLPLKVKNAIEVMKRREEIIYLSYHDKLTGLYNRRFIEEEINRLDTARNLPISFIIGDVNGLKLTNDAFGHEVGDRMLIKIAGIIKNECRKDEMIARIGGDEFLIALPQTSAEDTEKIVTRIKLSCEAEKEESIKLSISLGAATKEHVNQDTRAIHKLAEERMYAIKLMESKSIKNAIVLSLRKTLDNRFQGFESHNNRLTELSDKMGAALALTNEQLTNLKLLASLHDIGFTAIPDNIFDKKNNCTSAEEKILRSHCEVGYRIAASFPELAHISNDILSHHERWDGSGYPQGLTGEDIPLNARIISVLDTYDTMLKGVFNHKEIPKKVVLHCIKDEAGKSFDPAIVKAFIKIMRRSL
jgi:diguanylate cyclase (GGDEF)-like protein